MNMNTEQRNRDLENFAGYTRNYDSSDPHIALKILHTHKVTQIMDKLCELENTPEDLAYLCFLAALCHDLGRFEQARIYHTFIDADSIDHAELSAKLLKEGPFLDHISPEDKKAVITAVRNHSRFAIEEGLDDKTLYLSRILRDADKLDIFRVFATEDLEVSCNGSLEQASRETISDPVYEAVMNHHAVLKSDRKTSLDIWTTFLGFFFDFNFDSSFAIAKEQGYYLQPFQCIEFQNPQTKQRVQDMLEEVDRIIEFHTSQNQNFCR